MAARHLVGAFRLGQTVEVEGVAYVVVEVFDGGALAEPA
jgi:hypothetical protein